MSAVLVVVIGRLVLAFVALAGVAGIAAQGRDGWGWFLFAALLLGCFTVEASVAGKKP